MIRHIHVNDCDSTQDLLKEQLNNQALFDHILISCENQNHGRGRGENIWVSMPGTICFSLNIRPHHEQSFTALEVSVLVARFFETKGHHLKLKWPNDLWDQESKKCAGILIQGSQNNFLAGIGINLFSESEEFGGVFETSFELDKKIWCLELAEFILSHRYTNTNELSKDWLMRCGHLNQLVKITEGSEIYEGVFQGIGAHGEAELCIDGKNTRLFNGTLRVEF